MKRWEVLSVGEKGSSEDDGDYLDRVLRGVDAHDAARLAVRAFWYGDPISDLPWSMLVKVREEGTSCWQFFRVAGRVSTSWAAEEVAPPAVTDCSQLDT